MRDRKYVAFVVVVVILLCVGCGGKQGTISLLEQLTGTEAATGDWPAELPADALQPWEELDADGCVIPSPRATSCINAASEFAAGVEREASSLVSVSDNGEAVRLTSGDAGSGQVSWAYWRLELGGVQPGAVSADVNVLPMSDSNLSSYYIGLSNYAAGNWDWHGPFSESHVRLSTAANVAAGADYLSPLGNLFICAVACNGATFDVVGVAANACDDADTEAPAAPTGLTATPVAGGLELAWNGVIAGDLAGYRVYWRDGWFLDAAAMGVKTMPFLEGTTRCLLPVQGATYVRVSAADISGNESELSEITSGATLAGMAPELRVTTSAPSGMLNDLIALSATGAENYDWDLDGDGVYEITADSGGAQGLDTSNTGLIRPAVRGMSGGGECVACGGVSVIITGNTRPVASAVADPQNGMVPLTVSFTGTAEDAEDDNEALTYAWDFNGDGVYEVDTDTLTPADQEYATPGIYGVKFRVTDTDGAWDVDTIPVQATVVPDPDNQPPVADLSGSTDSGDAPLQVHYDAGGSSDPDGTIVEYAWDFTGDGIYTGITDVPTYTYEYTEPGLYVCKVRVEDEDGERSTDTFEVTVNAVGNSSPVADIYADPVSGDAPLAVDFDASGSQDIDGSIVRYDWDFDQDWLYEIYDGPDETEYFFTKPGIYTILLRVTDDDGSQDSDSVDITVNAPGNDSPTADMTIDPAYGPTPLAVDFDATGSSDTDGSIVRYDWDFDGDGNYELYDGDDQPTWTYSTYGSFTAKVRVTDDDGAQATDTVDIGAYTWESEVVDQEGIVGQNTSMVRINANPAISYYDYSNQQLKYVRAGNKYGTAWNTPVVVDDSGWVGGYTSLCAVDGCPAISYIDYGNADLKYVRAIDCSGNAWGAPLTVDSTGDTGWHTSLCVVNGNPAISYYDHDNEDLMYVRASNASGSAWNTPVTIDSTGNVGEYTCMIVVNGNPAISYYDRTNGDLKFVRASDTTGGTWNTPVAADSTGNVGSYPCLYIVNGNPAISYLGGVGDMVYVRASNSTGSAWNSPVTLDSTGNVGHYSSLRVADGNPAISYYDASNDHLKYVRATDTNGSTWDTPVVVDSSSGAGEYTSMLAYGGHVYISYFIGGQCNLKFAVGSF